MYFYYVNGQGGNLFPGNMNRCLLKFRQVIKKDASFLLVNVYHPRLTPCNGLVHLSQ